MPNRKTVEVLEIEVAELEAALSSVESEMRDRIGALTAKYNEMREKDRKIISVEFYDILILIYYLLFCDTNILRAGPAS